MVTKNRVILYLLFLSLLSFSILGLQTPYGTLEETSNSNQCSTTCTFELLFTPNQNINVPIDLTFNHQIASATVDINAQRVVTMQRYLRPTIRTYTYTVCDSYDSLGSGEPICLASHEEQGTATDYPKEINKSTASFSFERGQSYSIRGQGSKSALTNTKWSLYLGNWVLDPSWNSSWESNGSIVLFAPHNSTAENLTANVTWNGFNSSFKYIYSWLRNSNQLLLLNMPLEGSLDSSSTKDYSGRGNNGTVNGPTWNSAGGYDQFGAYEFDGVNDYLAVADKSYFSPANNNLTISLWARIPVVASAANGNNFCGSGGNYLITKGASSNWEWGLESDNNNLLCFNTWLLPSGNGHAGLSQVRPMNDSKWHHYVWTYNYLVNATLYVDGEMVNTTSTFSGTMGDGTQELNIGRRGDGNYFNGTLDDITVYNRTLSPQQVRALYNNRTDLIVSQETRVGDIWIAEITPNDRFSDGMMKESNGVIITSSLDLFNLSLLYTNSYHQAVSRFFIRNLDTVSRLVNWEYNAGDSNFLNSDQSINLSASENISVFTEYNYGTFGVYTITANASSDEDFDKEERSIEVG